MDVKPEPSTAPTRGAQRPAIGPTELPTILSNLSQELCRPLISLRAGLHLLLDDAQRELAREHRVHVRAMVGLCEDLLETARIYLDYAGLVHGSRPLCCGSFTLGALIHDIDRRFAADAHARQLAWSCQLDGGDAAVVTDASRCQQVFGNLVLNALKYTPPGGVVEVVGRHEGPTWSLCVHDTGPGIPADAHQRVFEPFYRLPRDEGSRVDSNGLGLAICREIVEQQMGGTIELESAPGRGTRITVRFPTRVGEPPRGG